VHIRGRSLVTDSIVDLRATTYNVFNSSPTFQARKAAIFGEMSSVTGDAGSFSDFYGCPELHNGVDKQWFHKQLETATKQQWQFKSGTDDTSTLFYNDTVWQGGDKHVKRLKNSDTTGYRETITAPFTHRATGARFTFTLAHLSPPSFLSAAHKREQWKSLVENLKGHGDAHVLVLDSNAKADFVAFMKPFGWYSVLQMPGLPRVNADYDSFTDFGAQKKGYPMDHIMVRRDVWLRWGRQSLNSTASDHNPVTAGLRIYKNPPA
jgi:endonuclease/exonuclease/phosphatase family metal-dependent hydrolase